MNLPASKDILTGEDLLAMGDAGPCELINGRIVATSPTGGVHGNVEANLAIVLGTFIRQHRLGWVLTGEVGIYTRRHPDRVRAADVVFVSYQQAPEGLPNGYLDFPPELVIEIISPSDRWQDIRDKLEEYFSIGVYRVWIVEPTQRTVLVYRTSTLVEKRSKSDSLTGEGSLQGFAVPVDTLLTG